jgi:Fe-S oxidoreductase
MTGIEVVHISQVAAEMIADGRIAPGAVAAKKATYHDPCMLGRLSEEYVPWEGRMEKFGLLVPPKEFRRGTYGCYDAPREVLRAIGGIELVEMPRNYEESYCCGAGGGARDFNPEFAQWAASERLREAASVDAEMVVSCCPFCQDSFEGAADAPEYCDLAVLLAKSLKRG